MLGIKLLREIQSGGYLSEMRMSGEEEDFDPFDLQVSTYPTGAAGEMKWMQTIGNSAPYETGTIHGTKRDAERAGEEARQRWIRKGKTRK